MVDTLTIDGNKVQHLLSSWKYKGYRLLAIHIEDGYELIAIGSDAIGVSTKAQNIERALYKLEGKIDRQVR